MTCYIVTIEYCGLEQWRDRKSILRAGTCTPLLLAGNLCNVQCNTLLYFKKRHIRTFPSTTSWPPLHCTYTPHLHIRMCIYTHLCVYTHTRRAAPAINLYNVQIALLLSGRCTQLLCYNAKLNVSLFLVFSNCVFFQTSG